MLAFIPVTHLSTYAPAVEPYSGHRTEPSLPSCDLYSNALEHALQQRALHQHHVRRQLLAHEHRRQHERALLAALYAEEEHAARIRAEQQRRARAEAEARVVDALLRREQEALARRRNAEAVARERAEFVHHERERIERARYLAELENLLAQKRHLQEVLHRSRRQPVVPVTAAPVDVRKPPKRVRFSPTGDPRGWFSGYFEDSPSPAVLPVARPPAYVKAQPSRDHVSESVALESLLHRRIQAEQDEEVRATAQALLSRLSTHTSVPTPETVRTAAPSPVPNGDPAPAKPTEKPASQPAAHQTTTEPRAELNRTPALAPAAAEKLLGIYRAHRARRNALASLSSIASSLDALTASFVFPAHLDFLPSPAASDAESDAASDAGSDASSTLAYSPTNAPLRAHEHALARLLTRLDAIPSGGDARVRAARKRLVRRVEAALAAMDRMVEERRRAQEEEPAAASPSADVPPELAPEANEGEGIPASVEHAVQLEDPVHIQAAPVAPAEGTTEPIINGAAEEPPAVVEGDQDIAADEDASPVPEVLPPPVALVTAAGSASKADVPPAAAPEPADPASILAAVDAGAAALATVVTEADAASDAPAQPQEDVLVPAANDADAYASSGSDISQDVSTDISSGFDVVQDTAVDVSSKSDVGRDVAADVSSEADIDQDVALDASSGSDVGQGVEEATGTFLLAASVPMSPTLPRGVLPAESEDEGVLVENTREEDGWSELEA